MENIGQIIGQTENIGIIGNIGRVGTLLYPIKGHSSQPNSIVAAHPCRNLWLNQKCSINSNVSLPRTVFFLTDKKYEVMETSADHVQYSWPHWCCLFAQLYHTVMSYLDKLSKTIVSSMIK